MSVCINNLQQPFAYITGVIFLSDQSDIFMRKILYLCLQSAFVSISLQYVLSNHYRGFIGKTFF